MNTITTTNIRRTSEELQFIADSLLMDKIAKLEAMNLTKNASAVDMLTSVLSGIAGSIANTARNEIDTSSPSSFISSLFSLLVPAMIFRIHPLLSGLYMIVEAFGLDIGSILTSIKNTILQKLTSGQKISPSDINKAGLAAGGLGAVASYDLFRYIKKNIKSNHMMRRNAQFLSDLTRLETPRGQGFLGLFPNKRLGVWGKLFAGMPRKRGKITLIGIIVWIVKTILASLGLLSIRNEVANFVGIDTSKQQQLPQLSQISNTIPTTSVSDTISEYIPFISSSTPKKLQPSGYGETVYKNTENDSWYVPIIGGSIKNTLLNWAVTIYPELKGHEQKISNLASFNRIVELLNNNLTSSSAKYVRIPEQFKSRKQIVDTFAKEAEDKIDFEKNSTKQQQV